MKGCKAFHRTCLRVWDQGLAPPCRFAHIAAQQTRQGLDSQMSIEAPQIKIVETRKVACDGGEGALGHPRVWLHLPIGTNFVECGYCDARYVLKGHEGT